MKNKKKLNGYALMAIIILSLGGIAFVVAFLQ